MGVSAYATNTLSGFYHRATAPAATQPRDASGKPLHYHPNFLEGVGQALVAPSNGALKAAASPLKYKEFWVVAATSVGFVMLTNWLLPGLIQLKGLKQVGCALLWAVLASQIVGRGLIVAGRSSNDAYHASVQIAKTNSY